MKIVVEKIIKNKNRIEIIFSQTGLEKFININVIPYFEYTINIENVPDSIAIIPFLCDIIPMAFVLDCDVYVKELDKQFYECIMEYRKAYSEMIPMIDFKGCFHVENIVDNSYHIESENNCLLFSGGIDATSSLCSNLEKINDCITIWGSDISDDNEDAWIKIRNHTKDIVGKFSKNWDFIKSNFRKLIYEAPLCEVISICGDNWWHAMQHGIALLGQVAPLAFLRQYSIIYIASSFTPDFQPICASDPRTDSCFKLANTSVIHDGYTLDRCEKVKNIFSKIENTHISLNIHVCWQDSSGLNCGKCEKCLRSYLNCRASGVDNTRLGINPAISMKEIKKYYFYKNEYGPNEINRLNVLQKSIKNTFGENVPGDIRWITNLKPEKIKKSLYWKIKKIYRRIKQKFEKLKEL